MTARVAVLVSGGGTNLQALLDAQQQGLLVSGRVVLVVSTREDAYALTRARQAGVMAVAFPRKTMGGAVFEKETLALLDQEGIDLIILAGFLSILSPSFVRQYENRIINVHPALIPAFSGKGYYGLKVHEEALKRGVAITGATVHLVNEEADGGPILLQKAVRVKKNDTPQSLQKRVMEQAEWVLLPRAAESMSKKICTEKEKQHVPQ